MNNIEKSAEELQSVTVKDYFARGLDKNDKRDYAKRHLMQEMAFY